MATILFKQGTKRHMAKLITFLKENNVSEMIVAEYANRYMTPLEIMLKQKKSKEAGDTMYVVSQAPIASVSNVIEVESHPYNKHVPTSVMWTGYTSGLTAKQLAQVIKEF